MTPARGWGLILKRYFSKIFLQIFLGNTSFGSEQTSLTLAAIHFQGKLRLLLYFEGNCSTTLVVAGLSMRGGEPPHYLRLTGNAALCGLGTIDFAANAMQGKKSKGEFCRLLERPDVLMLNTGEAKLQKNSFLLHKSPLPDISHNDIGGSYFI